MILRSLWINYLRQTEMRAMIHAHYSLLPSEPEGRPSIAASLAELDRAQLRAASADVQRYWR
jgi:hypothetical protein